MAIYFPEVGLDGRKTVTYGAKDLNDGIAWFFLDADLGERVKTYDERRSYTGAVTQYNVTEANLIHMRLSFRLEGVSAAAIDEEIAALNTLIDAGAQTLTFGVTEYSCLHSQRVSRPQTATTESGFVAWIDFCPVRSP